MAKIRWQYYFARKFSLQRFQIVANVFYSNFYREHFGVCLRNVMIKPGEGGNHEIWLDGKEYEKAIHNIFDVVCKSLKNFYYYKRMIKQVQNNWVHAATKVGRQANPRLSIKELAKLYETFVYYHQEHFNKPIWIPFPIEPLLAEAAEGALVTVLQRAEKMSDYDHWFQVVFSPEEKNAITRAHESLLRGALQVVRHHRTRVEVTDQLASRYGFIPCYDVIDAPWDSGHFSKELAIQLKHSPSQIAAELKKSITGFRKRRRDFRVFLRTFKMKKRERELLIMTHELVFIKDERDDYRRLGCYFGRPLFAEIGRRIGLTLREACYLSIEETRGFLKRGVKPPSVREIRIRMRGYLLMRKHAKPMVIASGTAMCTILKHELGRVQRMVQQEVRGLVGSPGKVKGSVAIVRTKHDLRRVFQGAIMVAVTTNPDFVPAMRKCKAIVTDEGGITSHAAIVSRELSIPCIVGTKLATKIFKDGDHVEVDATRGIVKKL